MPIFLDVLDPKRQKAFLKLKAWAKDGILAGGTAISLQLKHRYSYDFDVFFRKIITKKTFRKAETVFPIREKLVEEHEQIIFITQDDIKITFLTYPFRNLHPPIPTSSLSIFDLRDLASDKAATIGRRGMWRDYVDLFCLFRQTPLMLKSLIKATQEKFGPDFSEKLFLEQLTYYDDIQDFHIDYINQSYAPRYIQNFLEQLVNHYTNKNLRSGL